MDATAADETNVKHAENMERLTDQLRVAEEALAEQINEYKDSSGSYKEREEVLTKENFQLRETVGKQNVAIVDIRHTNEQLKAANALSRTDAEREVAGVQSELSRALEQAVKDADKARLKLEEG
jgi:hypothetical protein|tara:strand:- start:419 stop:790 length:372 start_codon:yes stop_codon:yes gene_type:complete